MNLEKLKNYENIDDIIGELDKIRGIGAWTAELTMVRGNAHVGERPGVNT